MLDFNGANAVVYLKEKDSIKYVLVETKRGFSLPGGAAEYIDKSVEDAIKRELKEELGLDEKDYSLKKTEIVEKFIYGLDKEGKSGMVSRKAVFLVESFTDKFKQSDSEVLNVRLCTEEEVIKKLTWSNSIEIFKRGIKLLKHD